MSRLQSRTFNGTSEMSLRDRIATLIMMLLSAGAVIAFTGAALELPYASAEVVVLETWRVLGYLVFAGIFLLLALRPRRYPGLWELAFLHKAGMAVAGMILLGGDAVGAGTVALIDGALAVLIVVAYILARGYSSWGLEWTTGEQRSRSSDTAPVVSKRPMVRGGQVTNR